MNLQPRFHLLTIVFFVVFAIPSWMAVRMIYAAKTAGRNRCRITPPGTPPNASGI
jgi:hypothetical protein